MSGNQGVNSMNIDELTVGQLREIAKLANGFGEGCKPKGAIAELETKRVILVVDRGWIFAGDQSLTTDGYIRLSNAVHVFRWEGIGFAKVVEDWRNPKVDLRKVADVEVPKDSVIFRVPVGSEPPWGIR